MLNDRYYYPYNGGHKYDRHRLCYVDDNDEPLETDQFIKKLTITQEEPYIKTRWIWYIVLNIISFIFIFLNTYYAYFNISCQNHYIPGIDTSLGDWLKISSYVIFASTINEIFTIIYDSSNKKIYYHIINFTHFLIVIFIFAWTIFGSYIYWHNYYQSNICSNNFNYYMFINLITMIIVFFIKLVLIFYYK